MKVLIFSRHDENPYQKLLYGNMKGDVQLKYLEIASENKVIIILKLPLFVLKLISMRFRGFKVLHIHWLYPLSLPNRLPLITRKYLSFFNRMVFLFMAKWLGYRIVWTIHNVLPHDPETINDLLVYRYLSSVAAHKIAHSEYTITEMKRLGFNTDRMTVIPHGNYTGYYMDEISVKSARKKLKINNNDFVILFFGQIRNYKGIDNLIKVMSRLKLKNAHLIIAGKCLDSVLRKKIIEAQQKLNIDLYDTHIEDKDVSLFYKACDVVCLPFKTVTTSGSAMLSLTFGKPVIAPRIGALLDLPESVGYFYDPKLSNGLEESISRAINDKEQLRVKGRNAVTFTRTLNWNDIAQRTIDVYKNALNVSTKI